MVATKRGARDDLLEKQAIDFIVEKKVVVIVRLEEVSPSWTEGLIRDCYSAGSKTIRA